MPVIAGGSIDGPTIAVDRMPVLGIDPKLLDFGHQVSLTPRNPSNVARGGSLRIEMRRTTDEAQPGTVGCSDNFG